MSLGSKIIGTGSCHPVHAMTNKDFEAYLDTNDEWIQTRTGIKERRVADPKKGETTLSLARGAAERALEKAGIKGESLDLIIVATLTPESVMPTTANYLQTILGAHRAFSFDFQAACAGFIYAMGIADSFIKTGTVKHALIIGADTLSNIVNWQDRQTAVLFGDGAGAAVLKATEDKDHRILSTLMYSDARYGSLLEVAHGYSKCPPFSADYNPSKHTIFMQGKEVFKLAVKNMAEAMQDVLKKNEVGLEDVDLFVFHQANMRILDMCAQKLGIDKKKVWINLDRFGNTSAATLPTCLDEAWRAGSVKPGDLVAMASFGGGVTWGSALLRL